MNASAYILSILLAILLQAGCSSQKETTDNKPADNSAQESEPDTVYVVEEQEEPTDSLFIAYEQTPCFGRCPVYKMHIYKSGFATFKGVNFLDRIGTYSYTFKEKELNKINELIDKAEPAGLKEKYAREGVVDLPSRKVTFLLDDGRKTVKAVQLTPGRLKVLIEALQDLAQNTEWKSYEQDK